MKYKIIITSFLFLLSALFLENRVNAQIPVAVPFGGPIATTYECTCSGGWFILLYDYMTKMPVPMVFQFGQSSLKANYNIITPKVQTVGSYTTGGVCLMASTDCGGVTVQGTVSPIGLPGIGTSLE